MSQRRWVRIFVSRAQSSYAAAYFDDCLPQFGSSWIASRPSLPDSLPAIGWLTAAPAVGYAFGHPHLGLTQAAVLAGLLLDLLSEPRLSIDPLAYDVARFS